MCPAEPISARAAARWLSTRRTPSASSLIFISSPARRPSRRRSSAGTTKRPRSSKRAVPLTPFIWASLPVSHFLCQVGCLDIAHGDTRYSTCAHLSCSFFTVGQCQEWVSKRRTDQQADAFRCSNTTVEGMLTRCAGDPNAPFHAFGAPARTGFLLPGVVRFPLLASEAIPAHINPAGNDGRSRDWPRSWLAGGLPDLMSGDGKRSHHEEATALVLDSTIMAASPTHHPLLWVPGTRQCGVRTVLGQWPRA